MPGLIRTMTAVVLACSIMYTVSHASENRGLKLVIKDKTGGAVGQYAGSRALLIGVANYTGGWPDLESIPVEIEEIGAALSANGFSVEKVLDPNAKQLKDAFENFIGNYGYNQNDRLLFIFAGHGYTRSSGKKGYLVPSDAPDPRVDETGFLRKALDMGQILSWSRQMEAKHALFLFDSCFSGTIFKTRALPKMPPHISDLTTKPVRQYITAGAAGEEVPAKSVFAPSFIRAIRGEGDINGDGYVTGTELGMYLHDKVLGYQTGQTPQYGKIRDPDLDEGDFVFRVASAGTGSFVHAASSKMIRFGGFEWEILNGEWQVDGGVLIGGASQENHIMLKLPDKPARFTVEYIEEYISGQRNSAVGHNWAARVIKGGMKRFRNHTSDVEAYGFNHTFDKVFNLFKGEGGGWYLVEPSWKYWQRSEHLADKTKIRIVVKDQLYKVYGNDVLITQLVGDDFVLGNYILYVGKNLQVKFSDFKFSVN